MKTISDYCVRRLRDLYPAGVPGEVNGRYLNSLWTLGNYNYEGILDKHYSICKKAKEMRTPFFLRGSLSGSFVLYLIGGVFANPLPAHYYCEACGYFEYIKGYRFGVDAPKKTCPKCKWDLRRDGYSNYEEFISHRNSLESYNHKLEYLIPPESLNSEDENILLISSDLCGMLNEIQWVFGRYVFDTIPTGEWSKVDGKLLDRIYEVHSNSEDSVSIILNNYKPANFLDYAEMLSVMHSTFMDEDGESKSGYSEFFRLLDRYGDIAGSRERLFEWLIDYGLDSEDAYEVTRFIYMGKATRQKNDVKWLEMVSEFNFPTKLTEYAERCLYLWPRTHELEYVLANALIWLYGEKWEV